MGFALRLRQCFCELKACNLAILLRKESATGASNTDLPFKNSGEMYSGKKEWPTARFNFKRRQSSPAFRVFMNFFRTGTLNKTNRGTS